MTIVQLRIANPSHNQVFKGATPMVPLRGQVIAGPNQPLYFTWYSSLFKPIPNDGRTTLNRPSDNALDFATPLGLGSHVVTFTAKDQPGSDIDAIAAVKHAGMTGGAPAEGIDQPCVVHVLTANIIAPASRADLDRQSLRLQAAAPALWGQETPQDSGQYIPNPDYHKPGVNRLQYHWFFTPVGAPARPSWDFVVPVTQLRFATDNPAGPSVEVVVRNGRSRLGTGRYRLALRVEDAENPSEFHQAARNITLT